MHKKETRTFLFLNFNAGKNAILYCLAVILSCIPSSNAFSIAQNNTQQPGDEDTDIRSLIFSVDYSSDLVYQGRTSDQKQPYLSPSLSYEAPSGFFTSFTADRFLSPLNSWEQTAFNLGWGFDLSEKSELFVSYTRINQKSDTKLLRSGLNNNLEIMFQRNSKILISKLVLDYTFGKSKIPNDFSITFENIHEFVFENIFTEDNDVLKIKPLIDLTAGTLNFYKIHLKNRTERPVLQNLSSQLKTSFNFTAIEFQLPIEYEIGRFSIEPAIRYSIPLNQPKIFNASPKTIYSLSVSFSIL